MQIITDTQGNIVEIRGMNKHQALAIMDICSRILDQIELMEDLQQEGMAIPIEQ